MILSLSFYDPLPVIKGLILIHRFPLSLLLFHNHRSLPVPIRGYHVRTVLTLSWVPHTSFLLPLFLPPSNFPPSHPTSPMPIQLHKIQLYRLWYLWQRLWRNVRPTSQCWAVSPAALFFCSPWRQRLSQFFAWRLIFSSTFLFSNL